MKPDVMLRLRFLLSQEGGRSAGVGGQFYACPMLVGDEGYDCRLILNGNYLELGNTYEIPVKFLNRDLALPQLNLGKSIVLWEGKTVATGTVIEIFEI